MKPDFSYKLTKRVEKYIKENEMIRHGDFVIAGLSGGADSVCLFLLLNKLNEEMGFTLHAVHINHCIRDEGAKADEQFSKSLCEKAGVPFTSYKVDVLGISKKNGLTVEEAGRNARYECFREYADKKLKGKSVKVAVAHHIDDQAETVIFNMVRGSGIRGIGGMRPCGKRGCITLIRPLLCVTKKEILTYLKFVGQDFCIDETNEDNDYSRNQIRNIVIRKLNEIQPKTSEHIALMSDEVREAYEYIDDVTNKRFEECVLKDGNAYKIDVTLLKDEKPIIVRELIILVLKHMIENYRDITKKHIEDVYGLFLKGKGKKVNLPYGLIAQKEKGFVVIFKNLS